MDLVTPDGDAAIKMGKSKLVKVFSSAVSVLWLLLLISWSIATIPFVPMDSGANVVKKELVSKLCCRNQCVDVNGGWCRLLGQHRCNGVIRLKNGCLVFQRHYDEKTQQKLRIAECCDYLKAMSIPYVVALAPQKMSADDSLGYGDWPRLEYNRIGDGYVEFFKRYLIPCLDMRNFCVDSTAVGNAFFKTDMHWTFDTALAALRELVPALVRAVGAADSLPVATEHIEKFKMCELDRSFCGSYGKRTGILFSGADFPVHYFTYNSMVDIAKSIPARNIFFSGRFDESVMDETALVRPKSHFEDRFYDCYGNGMIPFVRYRNASAPIKKKVLIIKDSFGMPIAAMASVVFEAVDVIDPRNFADASFFEYVRATEPDIVAFIFNTSGDWKPGNSFWVKSSLCATEGRGLWKEVYGKALIHLDAKGNPKYYGKVCDFSGDGLFRVIIGGVDISSGMGITISVQDVDLKKEVRMDTFAASPELFSDFPIVYPLVGLSADRRYRVLVYAGVRGHTKNNLVKVRDFRLERLIPQQINGK